MTRISRCCDPGNKCSGQDLFSKHYCPIETAKSHDVVKLEENICA
jgi:hypothetical protein